MRDHDAILRELDWSEFEAKYHGTLGARPVHPQVLMSIILYGHLTRVRSSRQLEGALWCRVDFRWLAEGERLGGASFEQFGKTRNRLAAVRDAQAEIARVKAAQEPIPNRIPLTDPASRVSPNKEGGFAPNDTPIAAEQWPQLPILVVRKGKSGKPDQVQLAQEAFLLKTTSLGACPELCVRRNLLKRSCSVEDLWHSSFEEDGEVVESLFPHLESDASRWAASASRRTTSIPSLFNASFKNSRAARCCYLISNMQKPCAADGGGWGGAESLAADGLGAVARRDASRGQTASAL